MIWLLLQRYFRYAPAFAVLHFALLIWCARLYFKYKKYAIELRDWLPERSTSGTLTEPLAEFLTESKRWSAKGLLVPMTDFSDRLDSLIDGVVDDLHSKVNLFLVIGIAGTFYGLFGFAVSAGTALNGPDEQVLKNLSLALTTALSNAFPVGFVGLIFMLAGHFVASRMEERLRTAAASATHKCMRARTLTVSPTQVLLEALEPFRNLKVTLEESLQPVISALKDELSKSGGLVEKQSQALQVAAAQIKTVVEGLAEHLASIRLVMKDIPAAATELTKAAALARAVTIEAAKVDERLQKQAFEVADAVKIAAEKVASLPEAASKAAEIAFTNFAHDSQKSWNQACAEFSLRMSEETINSLEIVKRGWGEMAERMAKAAGDLSIVCVNATQVISTSVPAAVKEVLNEFRAPIQELGAAFSKTYPSALQTAAQHLEALNSALQQSAASAEAVPPVVQSWKEVLDGLKACVAELAKIEFKQREIESLEKKVTEAERQARNAAESARAAVASSNRDRDLSVGPFRIGSVRGGNAP